MRFGRSIYAAFLALCGIVAGGPADAQTSVFPPLPISVQDLIQIAVPATGDTVVSTNNTTVLIINASGLLAALTVTMPSSPVDNQRWMVASGAAITLLTINGGTIKGAATGLSINGYARFIYSASVGAWFRTG